MESLKFDGDSIVEVSPWECETDKTRKEIKNCFKLVGLSQSDCLPVESKKELCQVISDSVLEILPADVDVFELIPDEIYSRREEENTYGKLNVWTPYEVEDYLHELSKRKHPNPKRKRICKDISLHNTSYTKDKHLELKRYVKLLKEARNTSIRNENKERIFDLLSQYIFRHCPDNIGEIRITEDFQIKRYCENREVCDIQDLYEYNKILKEKE